MTSTEDEISLGLAKAMAELRANLEALPDAVNLPERLTPEYERMEKFKKVCDARFLHKIDRAKLANPRAFDRVADWNGSFPGPLAIGPTGLAKTRAAWSALGRLWVREGKAFAWFPVKRLITEFERYESKGYADEFWKAYSPPRFKVLFVDDIDKLNWQFESQGASLWAFYDWVYRAEIACITTTNKPEEWWEEKMGEAFVRRLFTDSHFQVKF